MNKVCEASLTLSCQKYKMHIFWSFQDAFKTRRAFICGFDSLGKTTFNSPRSPCSTAVDDRMTQLSSLSEWQEINRIAARLVNLSDALFVLLIGDIWHWSCDSDPPLRASSVGLPLTSRVRHKSRLGERSLKWQITDCWLCSNARAVPVCGCSSGAEQVHGSVCSTVESRRGAATGSGRRSCHQPTGCRVWQTEWQKGKASHPLPSLHRLLFAHTYSTRQPGDKFWTLVLASTQFMSWILAPPHRMLSLN